MRTPKVSTDNTIKNAFIDYQRELIISIAAKALSEEIPHFIAEPRYIHDEDVLYYSYGLDSQEYSTVSGLKGLSPSEIFKLIKDDITGLKLLALVNQPSNR